VVGGSYIGQYVLSKNSRHNLPAAMASDPCSGAGAVELDIERRPVSREGQSWGNDIACAFAVVRCAADLKLRAGLERIGIGDFRYIPRGKAKRVAIVLSLDLWAGLGPIQVAMEIEFLSWIVCMDIGALPVNIVGTVFHTVDSTGDGVLSNAHRVSQSPPKSCTSGGIILRHVGVGADIKRSDLAYAGSNVGGQAIDVVLRATADDQSAFLLLAKQDGPSDMARASHAIYQSGGCARDGAIVGVVRPPHSLL